MPAPFKPRLQLPLSKIDRDKKFVFPDRFTLIPVAADIRTAKCASRPHCILAHATTRQLRLGPNCYLRVDAACLSFTVGDKRGIYVPDKPQKSMQYIRTFDEIGLKDGQDHARKTMEAMQDEKQEEFPYHLDRIVPKAKYNAERNKASAARKKAGVQRARKQGPYLRHTGV